MLKQQLGKDKIICNSDQGSLKTHLRRAMCSKAGYRDGLSKRKVSDFIACPRCNRLFSDESEMIEHFNLKNCKSDLTLPVSTPSPKKSKIEATDNLPKQPKAKSVKCKKCQIIFSSLPSLQRHMRRVNCESGNKQGPNVIVCKPCNSRFSSMICFTKHDCVAPNEIVDAIKIRNPKLANMTNNVACDTCQTPFSSIEEAERHKERDHDGYFSCPICKLIYKGSNRAAVHLVKRHNITLAEAKKIVANLPLYQNGELTRDVEISFNVKDKTCPICFRTLSKNHTMRRHVRHLHTVVKCPLCPKEYPSARFAFEHISMEHSMKLSEAKTIIFETIK